MQDLQQHIILSKFIEVMTAFQYRLYFIKVYTLKDFLQTPVLHLHHSYFNSQLLKQQLRGQLI